MPERRRFSDFAMKISAWIERKQNSELGRVNEKTRNNSKQLSNFELPHSLCSSSRARVYRFVIQYSVYNLLIFFLYTPPASESSHTTPHTHTHAANSPIYALFMASKFQSVFLCDEKCWKKTPTIASGGPRNQQTKQLQNGNGLAALARKIKYATPHRKSKTYRKKLQRRSCKNNRRTERETQTHVMDSRKWEILVPITLKIAIRSSWKFRTMKHEIRLY